MKFLKHFHQSCWLSLSFAWLLILKLQRFLFPAWCNLYELNCFNLHKVSNKHWRQLSIASHSLQIFCFFSCSIISILIFFDKSFFIVYSFFNIMQWFCPRILAWIDLCVDSTHQNWSHSCSNATACVQQAEIHGNCGSLSINIFPDPFMLGSRLLVFQMLCLHGANMNHITKRHILHKVKQQNANRPCQWFCNPQFRVVIFLSLQKVHIIFWSIDLQDIVRLWHKVNDMICPHRFHLSQPIRTVETK